MGQFTLRLAALSRGLKTRCSEVFAGRANEQSGMSIHFSFLSINPYRECFLQPSKKTDCPLFFDRVPLPAPMFFLRSCSVGPSFFYQISEPLQACLKRRLKPRLGLVGLTIQ